jgi:hypothetical protein
MSLALERYQQRQARYVRAEYEKRLRDLTNASASVSISTGAETGASTLVLIDLLASGRITEDEYMQLCVTIAKRRG